MSRSNFNQQERLISGFTDALAPNYVRHSQAMPPELQEIYGREAMHNWLVSCFATFPDYREELEWLVGEADFVAWRSRGIGTQSGAFVPFPPTNKRMELVIIGMHRFGDCTRQAPALLNDPDHSSQGWKTLSGHRH